MKKYDRTQSWIEYRDILRGRFGFDLSIEPTETMTSIRGHSLHIDVWEPASPAKGTIIIIHGAGGNGRIVGAISSFVTEQGWRVIAPDLPGYGLTIPSCNFDWDYAEWPAVLAELIDATDGKVVLFGTSLGGFTALAAAQAAKSHVDGVIVTTLLDMSIPKVFQATARWLWLGRVSLLAFRLFPWFIDRIVLPLWLIAPLNAMSADTKMQTYFKNDALIGRLWVPLRFFRTLTAFKVDNLDLPCSLLVVHPGNDRWTAPALSSLTFDRINTEKEFLVLSCGSHLPAEPKALMEMKCAISSYLSKIK